MPKKEQAGDSGVANSSKPNQGQDEKLHTFVNDAGETREDTMRWFRDEGRGMGWRKPEEPDEPEPEQPS